jgi:hypothetical protein
MINDVFYKPPEKKKFRGRSGERGPWSRSASSYSTIRKLPIQKGTNAVDEVRHFTI